MVRNIVSLPMRMGGLGIRSAQRMASDGTAQPGAARMDGAVCTRAQEDKERKYSKLLHADRCRLVVVTEIGGRLPGGKFGGSASP